MANIKSAIKRAKTSEKRRLLNKNNTARVRTFIKKVESALLAGDAPAAQTAFQELQPQIARSEMHKNTISRQLSRLAGHIKTVKSGEKVTISRAN